MRRQTVHALAFVAGLGLAMASSLMGAEGASGNLRGRLVLELPEVALAELGPMVAYLVARDDEPPFQVPREITRISQQAAEFKPKFLVVVAGQTVEMPNDDTIAHNVFSISPGNGFDLGLYPKGTSRSVTFREPGVVRVYCSIHARMNATIFVAPTPYYDRLAIDGSFELAGVPPGAYRLSVWSRKLPDITRELEIMAGEQTLELRLVAESETGTRGDPARH